MGSAFSSISTSMASSFETHRGACHRSRIRATRWRCSSDELPSLHAHRAWRGPRRAKLALGVGGGGVSAETTASVNAALPPTPDPSPPLRGGRGEDDPHGEHVFARLEL